jgi:Raf kinase inhibitor-like YbhB/YbcL family protein
VPGTAVAADRFDLIEKDGGLMERSSTAGATGLRLTSSAFRPGELIPARHACDGEDLSPPLTWSDPPHRTRTFALIVEDPDAPRGIFTHWIIFDLPSEARHLPEGVPPTERPPRGGVQGLNDFGNIGYNGPCPPPGPEHHYRFLLYALDDPIVAKPRMTRIELLAALDGHVVTRAELIGTYRRRR